MKLSRAAVVVAATIASSVALAPAASADHSMPDRGSGDEGPLITGHRGAPGYLPDHTLEGYKLAIEMGADYIEPDLVSTKDGHLIARHEPNIGGTTDVAEKFPESRKRTRNVDGAPVTDYFATDFTLKEIRTLRAVQPLPDERPTEFDGQFKIPTFDEVLELVKREGRKRGRAVGVYPETKHPTFHQQLGLPLERKVVDALKRHGLNHKRAPVIIQSFEQANLRFLNRITPVTLAQLVDAWDVNLDGTLQYAETSLRPYDWTVSGDPALLARTYGFFATNAGLDEIRQYADIVAPWKPYIVPTTGTDLNGDGTFDDVTGDGLADERDREIALPTSLIRRAHKRGLDVHTWTFRNEPRRLASDYFRWVGDDDFAVDEDQAAAKAEYKLFFALGIDGLFSDFPDTAVQAREEFLAG
jgi:glycerophosphoryl diester phosphodiesterase